MRIVRAGGRFRVVLHTEERQRFVAQAFERLVVQVHMRQLDFVRVDRVGIDGEVMIVRRDLDFAGGIVAHRVVAAVMAKLELVGAAAQSQSAKLVAQANAKHRHAAQHLPDGAYRVVDRFRVAGAVRQKHAVGLERQGIVCGGLGRDYGYAASLAH